MKILVDTHLLLRAAVASDRMSDEARELLDDLEVDAYYSPASVWEVAIKTSLGRADFRTDPHVLRRGLEASAYLELPITSVHTAAVIGLPPIHRDPFDRVLVAQAMVEGITLVTSDALLARYPGPVRLV